MRGMKRLCGDTYPHYLFQNLLGTFHEGSQKGDPGHGKDEGARVVCQETSCDSGGTRELPADGI